MVSAMGAVVPSILTGCFTLVGGLGGILLTSLLNSWSGRQRQLADDQRRWLSDRRQIYARFLSLCEVLLREVDDVAAFMPYDDTQKISEEDKQIIHEGSLWMHKLDEDLQSVLFEVQLMASPDVADLAERMSGALFEVASEVSSDRMFVVYYPAWFQARDMLQVLRNGMRAELDLPPLKGSEFPRPRDWPWLPDRPARETYRQGHTVHDRKIGV